MPKVGFLTNIYTPYKEALLRELGKLVDLNVYYCSLLEKGRTWDIHFSQSYSYKILSGMSFSVGLYHYHINPSLYSVLKKDNIDILIVGGYSFPTVMGAPFICKKLKIPCLLWCGSTKLERKKEFVPLVQIKKWIVSQYDGYIAYTNRAKEYLESLGAPNDAIVVAPVTVDTDYFISKSDEYKKAFGRKFLRKYFCISHDDDIVISFVGSLIKRKNLSLLLDALKDMKVPFTLLVAGSGPLEGALKQKAYECGLEERVCWLGDLTQDELVKLYCATDIFVLPSDREPSGNVINEAMSTGCPVIISDQIGTDIVSHAKNGFIFSHRDVDALRKCISAMVKQKDLRITMGENAQRDVQTKYSIQYEAEQFKTAIDGIMQEHSA